MGEEEAAEVGLALTKHIKKKLKSTYRNRLTAFLIGLL